MRPKNKIDGKGFDPFGRNAVTIVKESKSNVILVIPDETDGSGDVRNVTEEFKKYFYKVSGVELPIEEIYRGVVFE